MIYALIALGIVAIIATVLWDIRMLHPDLPFLDAIDKWYEGRKHHGR